MKLKRIHKILIGVGFVLIFAFLLMQRKADMPSTNGTVTNVGSDTVLVEIKPMIPSEIQYYIRDLGIIEPVHKAVVASEVSGEIKKVLMRVGKVFQSGDALVTIDPEVAQLTLQQASAVLLNAEADYLQAKRDLERSNSLRENNDISRLEHENAILRGKRAHSVYLQAEASEKLARRNLRKTNVTAPFTCVIANKLIDLGENVAPGTPIAEIVDLTEVRITVGISEKDYSRIQLGQEVEVIADAYPGKVFNGKVFSVSPAADQQTRTFDVEISLNNTRDVLLKSGMAARVGILTGKNPSALLVPLDAVLERRGQSIVFVVREGKADRRVVRLGQPAGEFAEVLEGIKAYEHVVVLGQENLVQGSPVKIINADTQ